MTSLTGEGVEAEVVDADVQTALAGHPALTAAARAVGDHLLCLEEDEPGLQHHHRFSELPGLPFLLSKPAAALLIS